MKLLIKTFFAVLLLFSITGGDQPNEDPDGNIFHFRHMPDDPPLIMMSDEDY